MPLAVILYSKLRLALAIRRRGIAGPELVLALARRRMWHQFVGILAMLAAPRWRWRCTRTASRHFSGCRGRRTERGLLAGRPRLALGRAA